MTSSVLLMRSGSTLRAACGRITHTMVCQRERPVERAASAWPEGTLSNPARKIAVVARGVEQEGERHRGEERQGGAEERQPAGDEEQPHGRRKRRGGDQLRAE